MCLHKIYSMCLLVHKKMRDHKTNKKAATAAARARQLSHASSDERDERIKKRAEYSDPNTTAKNN